jgi:hypothetical protein
MRKILGDFKMKKHLISISLVICVVSSVSLSKSSTSGTEVEQLHESLFGVSTLKGIKDIFPQVQMEIIKEGETELRYISKIESLDRNDLEEQVLASLDKAGIQTSKNIDITSPESPLSLNVTVFIKVASTTPASYVAFIYTEAIQAINLSRDNTIRSSSRTWPFMSLGLYNRNMFVLNAQTLEKTVKDEVARQVGYFITDFLAANPKPAGRSAAGVDIEALRKTLLKEDPNLRYRGYVKEKELEPYMQAIQQLQAAGSEEATDALLAFLTHNRMNRNLKIVVLTALGQIGTESAVEAVRKFEDWSQKRFSEPQLLELGTQESEVDHFGGFDAEILAQSTDSEKKKWAIIPLNRYGNIDIWLVSMNDKKQWSEPIFINFPDFLKLRNTKEIKWNLNVKGDSVRIESDKVYEYKISDLLKDSDKDGLPDIVEERFLTDPKNPDSDKDGVQDGKDSNPLTPKHKDVNDTTEIRQAVFSALFATSNSQNAIVIVDRGEFAKQEYYGFGGVVLKAPKARDGFVNVTSIDIKYQSSDAATVNISDWEGSMAASVHEAKLKKINGKWVVVEFRLTLIS